MPSHSVGLQHLLLQIRQSEFFPELCAAIKPSRIQPFKLSEAEKPETARSRFIYQSGQVAQFETTVAILSGDPTSQQGD